MIAIDDITLDCEAHNQRIFYTQKTRYMYYVIQVQTGKENKTISEMNERISETFTYEAFTPKYRFMRKFKESWREIEKAYFPGYVFVETDDPKELFKQLFLEQLLKYITIFF